MTHDVRKLSLLKPTGHLTLGNYLGAVREMTAEQSSATCFYGIADLHALTVPHDPATLRMISTELATLLLACGVDATQATLFVQSQVPAHAEMCLVLESTAHIGELSRMIAFKEKGAGRPRTRVSLYTYPTLMAADILLYRATVVPVGDDQRQHVELTRDLALRFNTTYGQVFTVPEITTPRIGARVMDLQRPDMKMGKSHESGAGIIYLLDEPDVIARKVARAVTDSETGRGAVRHESSGKPGVSNLLEIIGACDGLSPAAAAAHIGSYGELKARTTEAVIGLLTPIQDRYRELQARPEEVRKIFATGAERCRAEAAPVLRAAKVAMGLVS